jgi:peptidoglycan/xylan/chitin deacetylase (PgdA/CDA1 family)
MRRQLKNLALQLQYYSALYRLIPRSYSGIGTIFIMHKVVNDEGETLASQLTITRDFFSRFISRFKQSVDFVSLDEVYRRLTRATRSKSERPFIALTFDDGFRDNLALALPILRRHGVPATIYVPSGAPDRSLDPWPWRLDMAIRQLTELSLDLPELPRHFSVRTWPEKRAAFRALTEYVHRDIPANRRLAETLLPKTQISDEAVIAGQFAGWDELRELASDPLITIGGHSVTHASLQDLAEDEAMTEITQGRERLRDQLGVAVSHFAYPYGDRSNCGPREFNLAAQAGFDTAVTAFSGNIFDAHQDHMMCLPRILLGGSNEKISSAVLDFSGAPTLLSSRWRNPVTTV